jgi:hypothetical protein
MSASRTSNIGEREIDLLVAADRLLVSRRRR